jgi:alpha-amylase/alpha-mannosidase (GH57 family)
MIQKLKLLLIASFAFLATKSNAQASGTITPAVTQQSKLFKSLQGKDRQVYFDQLKSLIKTESQKVCLSKVIKTFQATTKAELVSLLGTPDVEVDANNFSYNISTKKQFGRITFKTNSASQILHYSITDIL